MSAITLIAAQRRRTLLLASSFLVPFLSLGIAGASAQQGPPQPLPPVEIIAPVDATRTRAKPAVADQDSGSIRTAPKPASRTGKPNENPSVGPAQSQPDSSVQATSAPAERQFNGIVGASSSVITAADIARSPAETVQEIIAQIPGVQLTTLYGGVNGAGTTVDMRGFGAFGSSNTLVLMNGRRLNDLDLQGVDLSTIPRDSIERIEVIRGNSGAVLYGDNAVGGVINIVTKTGVSGPPLTARVESGFGSFNQKMGAASVATHYGPWSTSFYGNGVTSDGYRLNNSLHQVNGVGDIRYTTPDFSAYLNLSADDQRLRLPGSRYNIAPFFFPDPGANELVNDRRGTNSPLDYANKQDANITGGFTKTIVNGVDLIMDGGYRDKKQQAAFVSNFAYTDAHLQTWSFTPRLSIKNTLFGMPSTILTGIDFYDYGYTQDRKSDPNAIPAHAYKLAQQSLGGYWHQTLGLLPTTDFSYGARVQSTHVTATDRLHNDPFCAPFCDTQAAPLNSTEINYATHIGLEHRFNNIFSVFGRAATAFRAPNIDERVGVGAFASPVKDFNIKIQTSNDVEGGFRIKYGAFQMQSSIYNMNLKNEIHFDPVNFLDYNLSPTRRYGSETSASYRVNDELLLRGGFAYTRAVFREGPFTGNDIPLVSRYTASGGVSWNIWKNYLVSDVTVRYWSNRRMDNDQPNVQPLIPANATVDFKLSGKYDHFFWSLTVNNVFNALYYDYSVASASTLGVFAAYPLPGRTYMVKAGATF